MVKMSESRGHDSLQSRPKPGWSWGCVSAIDSKGRAIRIADAHRDDGKRYVVRADEKLVVPAVVFS